MYNAEKFISSCLESILAQTFKDFEVIVTDDCSTDKSYAIVENYKSQESLNLKLLRRKKNSGGCAIPRNNALLVARGKYIQFLDSDDMLTPTMLEELYQLAETSQADVIYTQQYFAFSDENAVKRTLYPQNPFMEVDKPTFETNNLAERVLNFIKGKYIIGPMQYFLRRDFLMENELFFPKILVSEDDFWLMKLICCAEKILCIPNVFYLNRSNPDSLTLSKKSPKRKVQYHMTPTIIGMGCMKEVLNETEFLKQNPQYWYAWVNRIVNYGFGAIFGDCANLSPYEVYEIFHQQFAQEIGENAELISFLCSMINSQQKQIYLANQQIAKLKNSDNL